MESATATATLFVSLRYLEAQNETATATKMQRKQQKASPKILNANI